MAKQSFIQLIYSLCVQVLDSGAMSATELSNYLNKMEEDGTWGDGIVLSAAVRLYATPIEIMLPDGSISSVDMVKPSPGTEPILLGLIIDKHYVGIQKINVHYATTRVGETLTQEQSSCMTLQKEGSQVIFWQHVLFHVVIEKIILCVVSLVCQHCDRTKQCE